MPIRPQPQQKGQQKKQFQNPNRQTKANIRRRESNRPDMNEQDMGDEEIDQYQDGNKNNDGQKLTAEELNKPMPSKMLVPNNPNAPKNITIYDYFQRNFKKDEFVDQAIIHFSIDGDYIWKESNEYQVQESIQETKKQQIKDAKAKQEQEEPGVVQDEEAIKQTLRNKFNYNTRECQTINPIIRERGVSTEPPPSDSICGNITQWGIFDSYMQFLLKENQQENTKKKKDHENENQEQTMYSTSFKRCCKIMERMVVQNDQADKYYDYRYYWNSGDNQEPPGKVEGHLLPIWRFSNEKQRKKNVTSICWNPRYPDLFAVSFGSYDFTKQRMGLICLYSLKNTTHPEYAYNCEAGVMCLDFHPKSAALLAVGLYDGTVLVYDIRNKHKKPIYQSTVRNHKHTDPVWQVKWNPDISKNYNFYSVSSDGRVMNWILMKNKLEPEEVILLRLVGNKNDEESTLIGLACGLCFDFNKFEPHIFLVGTEEGNIHKCSRAYSGQYQETYKGHLLAVYKVKWNNFHSRTFISASADWTVRIWDSKYTAQLMCFDLSMQVVDAVWAPYSSTVFACATMDKVLVYDLNVDKHKKIGEQKIVKQPKLTNLAFNYRDKIILVGDSHGGVTLVKLSPNLCKSGPEIKVVDEKEKDKKPGPGQGPPGQAKGQDDHHHQLSGEQLEQYERQKLENILVVVTKWERDDV